MRWNVALKNVLNVLLVVLTLAWGLPSILLGYERESVTGQEELQAELRVLLEQGMENSENVPALLKLAAVYLDLGYGVYVDPAEKKASFNEGARMAKKALLIHEDSAEAHFLYAANLGSAAELEGLVSSALTIQELKRHVHRVLELDETYAPAHHMLGRLYEELPWLLGGNQAAAGEHLEKAVTLNPLYAPGRLDWAKWLVKQGRIEEARRELNVVIEQPPLEKKWIWEQKHRPEAMLLLRQISLETKSVSSSP